MPTTTRSQAARATVVTQCPPLGSPIHLRVGTVHSSTSATLVASPPTHQHHRRVPRRETTVQSMRELLATRPTIQRHETPLNLVGVGMNDPDLLKAPKGRGRVLKRTESCDSVATVLEDEQPLSQLNTSQVFDHASTSSVAAAIAEDERYERVIMECVLLFFKNSPSSFHKIATSPLPSMFSESLEVGKSICDPSTPTTELYLATFIAQIIANAADEDREEFLVELPDEWREVTKDVLSMLDEFSFEGRGLPWEELEAMFSDVVAAFRPN